MPPPSRRSPTRARASPDASGAARATRAFETFDRVTVEGLLGARVGRYPAVVVQDEERVLGFAWTSEYRPRQAYAGVAEFSVYVAREARSRGVGRLCLGALITEADRRGFWKLVSRIFPENVAE